jgi:CubicO group peptidase (beta-lactamase class C family)
MSSCRPSCSSEKVKLIWQTYWAIASNSKLMAGLTLAMLQERNVTLANGGAYTLDTPLVDVVEGFKMWDNEITQSITTRDFLSMSASSSTYLLSCTIYRPMCL